MEGLIGQEGAFKAMHCSLYLAGCFHESSTRADFLFCTSNSPSSYGAAVCTGLLMSILEVMGIGTDMVWKE